MTGLASESDSVLLKLVFEGDDADQALAYRELQGRHGAAAARAAGCILAGFRLPLNWREDACQEGFFRLGLKRAMVRERESLGPLVRKLVCNAAWDLVRGEARQRRLAERLRRRGPSVPDPSPYQGAVEEALAALTPGDRELLVERYLIGVPIRQMADSRGVTVTRLYRALHTARRRAREAQAAPTLRRRDR